MLNNNENAYGLSGAPNRPKGHRLSEFRKSMVPPPLESRQSNLRTNDSKRLTAIAKSSISSSTTNENTGINALSGTNGNPVVEDNVDKSFSEVVFDFFQDNEFFIWCCSFCITAIIIW